MKVSNKALVLLNTITFLVMLFVNYTSNARLISDITVADVAHKYDSLFAPADYAFIIWGLIFLMCAAFVVYQWVLLKNDSAGYIQRTGLWFALSNIANALWVFCWINEWMAASMLVIFVLLCTLIQLTIELRLELDDVPVRAIVLVWWPIAVYLGWIVAATVACVASYLVSTGWDGFGLSAATWTIIMIIIALAVYLYLIKTRNLREAAAVGMWAFVAIAVRHWNEYGGIVATGLIAAAILFMLSGWHGYKNRYYSPANKIRRGEW